MAETLTIRTASSTEVVKIAVPGPQGPAGPKGDPGDVAGLPLTTQGDTLYRGASENQRLPIGTSGQILKVSAGGIPEWGAAPATGVTSVALASSDLTITGSPITSSGTITANVTLNGLTLNKLETINTAHFLGRHGSGAGDVQPVSASQARTILNVADGAEVNVQSNWTEADSGSDAFILNKPTSLTPTAHADSHGVGQADELLPSAIGAQSIFLVESLVITTTSQVTLTAARAKIYDIVQYAGAAVDVKLPSANALQGDIVVFRWGTGSDSINVIQSNSPSTLGTITSGQQKRFIRGSTDSWSLVPVDTHTHAAADITSGTLDIARLPTGTNSTQVALGDHTHTQLHDRSHAITSTSDHTAGTHKVFYSDGSGNVQELALGETGTVLTSGGTATAPSFAAASGGISAVGASTADVLSVSGSDLVADDGGTIDSADPFIKWDDTAGKLVYANPLSRPSGAFYVGLAPTTTALGSNAINIQATRTGATNLASGQSAICIGTGGNTASGQDSISIGVGNAVSALRATAIGYANTASAQESVALGSLGFASGVKSVGINEASVLRGQVGFLPFRSVYWGGQTTNATATVLGLDVASGQRFTIAASTALAVDILLVARRSDTADKWLVARRFLGIRRDGSNNTSLIGTVQTLGTDQSEGSPSWTFTLTADDVNECLQLEVQGANSETVQWRATAFYRVV